MEKQAALQDGDEIQVALAEKLTFIGTEATLPLSLSDASQMGLGNLRMDAEAHRVWVQEKEVEPPLSPPQFRLLEILYKNYDRVVSRDEIASFVWPGTQGVGVSDQAIDALVRRLRDRLAEVDPSHTYVETVRGHPPGCSLLVEMAGFEPASEGFNHQTSTSLADFFSCSTVINQQTPVAPATRIRRPA